MTTASLASIIGLSLLAVALIVILFSPYRRWLSFMFAGMLFWGVLEALRYAIQRVFEWSVTSSYLLAIFIAMILMTALLLREDRKARQATAKRRYIEHTPVYEDDQQQYSSR
ncbi:MULTISPECIES: AciT family ciprofloxacin tolerance protein [unclassified Acinetobacter]|uniref:AciT family ciprofloxacin tolerance protein n=1 Tax=unclassified Acinetobacter TaxID=196816 RepID=UPI0029342C19|nr:MULTISPECIES: AciT family ciprofloxacin tolerance protein [unclassified Acinetobacter]WOE30927.1 hypothetical protein QSG84_11310 [Acinetobacter sp. SAAs470]WOE39123.1 hypothetical protein QSG86_04975 [Acinetobacter sp. SAAs474]